MSGRVNVFFFFPLEQLCDQCVFFLFLVTYILRMYTTLSVVICYLVLHNAN